MRLNAKQVAACTGGDFVVEPGDASALLTGLQWDSRKIAEGDLYVALPGERVDGHDFIIAAIEQGARGALTMQPVPAEVRAVAQKAGAFVMDVPDTFDAITDLAGEWRKHLKARIIALTGSTGKTTTKNLVRDVLSYSYKTVATEGNQNNELGVPKTILNADLDTQAVVVEMGMRGAGQISSLCSFVRPDWGIVVNVGESHIELLGSRENIARAKAELLCDLPERSGVAFVNGADDFCGFICKESHLAARGVKSVTFNGSGDVRYASVTGSDVLAPAVWAEQITLDDFGCPTFCMHARGFADDAPGDRSITCSLALRGLHNVSNACCAAAVGLSFGMSLADVASALSQAQPESGRQEVLETAQGVSVINDAYNANPDSMRASLTTFAALAGSGKRIAVLGDMGELGSFAPDSHRAVGALAATLPIDRLVCVGELARLIADSAVSGGMDSSRVVWVESVPEAFEEVVSFVQSGDAVLVKASHFMGLDRIVEGLVG